jgi:hypothetical protein
MNTPLENEPPPLVPRGQASPRRCCTGRSGCTDSVHHRRRGSGGLGLNYPAIEKLPARTQRRVEIIGSATHLFEESSAVELSRCARAKLVSKASQDGAALKHPRRQNNFQVWDLTQVLCAIRRLPRWEVLLDLCGQWCRSCI